MVSRDLSTSHRSLDLSISLTETRTYDRRYAPDHVTVKQGTTTRLDWDYTTDDVGTATQIQQLQPTPASTKTFARRDVHYCSTSASGRGRRVTSPRSFAGAQDDNFAVSRSSCRLSFPYGTTTLQAEVLPLSKPSANRAATAVPMIATGMWVSGTPASLGVSTSWPNW